MIRGTTVNLLKKVNVVTSQDTELTQESGRAFGGSGLDAGGKINLNSGTSLVLSITDATGFSLYTGTLSASATVDATAHGLKGPISVSAGAGDGVVTIWWWIKK